MPYKDLFSLDATSWSSLFADNATVAGGIPAAIRLAASIPTCGVRAGAHSAGVVVDRA